MKKLLIIGVLLIFAVGVMHFKAEAYVVDPCIGVCKPKVENTQVWVCVITSGTKNCNKDGECVAP